MSVKSIIARYEADLLEVNPQIIKTNACYNEAQDQRAPDKELRALDNVVWPLLEQRSALDKQKKRCY